MAIAPVGAQFTTALILEVAVRRLLSRLLRVVNT
jgi:hypothetical protein